MIRIIEPGKTTFTVKCTQCECTYAYELGNILTGGTYCPCCGEFNLHSARIKNSLKKLNKKCPFGGDTANDCKDCVYAHDYHFVNGECVRRKGSEK